MSPFHLGQRIKQKVEEQGITVSAFADAMSISRSSAYKLFDKQKMNTKILEKACHILKHDFFKDLSATLRK